MSGASRFFAAAVVALAGVSAHAITIVQDGRPVATIVVRESVLSARPYTPA